jgi:hypothetical protein
MDIDSLTIGQAKQLAAMFGGTQAAASSYTAGDGRAVIVRARDAGVHFGYLVGFDGRRVDLTNSRRLWSWMAAEDGSLSGVAVHGIDASKSKVAAVVAKITILDACEIIDVSAHAAKTIEAAKWA